MLENNILARPYAKAIFEIATQQNALGKWSQLLGTAAAIADDQRVKMLLIDPRIRLPQRVELFTDVGAQPLDETWCRFIEMLAENQRLHVLPQIKHLYDTLKAEEERTVKVTVISAMPLQEAYQEKLIVALKKRLQREVTLQCNVDKDLIGGALIRTDDCVIDGSIRGQLNRLKNKLSS